ncbi:restriction endonuclease subunit S [Ferrovum myxofaciens]|uniref:restriction endonuclease subunit S n=1 Tax=Ferrovum myxofaciens TaxID=416213 RepID=UPI003EBBFA45
MSFSRYPKYKDSGVEWLGEVPECWGVTRISRLFNIKAGGDIKEQFFSVNCTEKYCYPIYTNTIKSDVIYGFTSKAFFPGNTITVTGRGDIGYAVYRDHPYDAIIRLLVLTPKNNDSCKYSMYFINSILNFHGGNTAISQLSTEQISPYLILNPPLQEQFAIATFLDRETAKMDALVAEQEKLIAILKEKRQAVISHAVTKGLDPSVPMKDSGVEWLGEVPESWERRKIAHAFERVGSGTTPPTGQDEWYSDGDIPWITTGELRETVITETSKYVTAKALEEFSTLRVYPAGSLAIAMYGATIGRLGILGVSATTNQACCVLSGEISLSIRFTYFWLLAFKQQIIDLYAAGGGQPNINQEVIANFRVPAPTIGDQVTITVFLDRETAKIDSLTAEAERGIVLLKERRSALISAAVTGKIDVRAFLQIPTNEQPWRTHD